ncbi:uncharacterized protein TM35_000371420 [Trypanosoma theileri]|uniref:Uncharacterized protein n=1 Tax=Trypanosoma theileri TaxID=67003 RepID=A0A1X0NM02_9TRYP|nr:uncharacterized protein TM35_000371420 [Trypanosoma theileri]ORC85169.1 hypothetical protein TM35_000371420 [Trypanosoma theileri]
MQRGGATIGEQKLNTKEYDFIGVHFNHKDHTVSLSDKTIKRLQRAPSLDNTTVEELESTVSRMMYAGGVRGESLFPYYFFLKIVRRRLSRLNRGLIRPQDPANLSATAKNIGHSWPDTLLTNGPVHPPQQLPSTATLVTDAPTYGWGALLFKDSGEVLAAGGAWEHSPPTRFSKQRRLPFIWHYEGLTCTWPDEGWRQWGVFSRIAFALVSHGRGSWEQEWQRGIVFC